MIVWSRGLGKLRLPLELPAATLHVRPDTLTMEGVIEPVCWRYAIKLGPNDLIDFLNLLSRPETAGFLAERGGLLLPFILNLVLRAPSVIMSMIFRKGASEGGTDAFLV